MASAFQFAVAIGAKDETASAFALVEKHLKDLTQSAVKASAAVSPRNATVGLDAVGAAAQRAGSLIERNFKDAPRHFRELGDGASHAVRRIGEIVPAVAGLTGALSVGGLVALTEKFATGGAAVSRTAQTIGMSAHDLQRFQGAAAYAGIGADTMSTSLVGLDKSVHDAAFGLEGSGGMIWASQKWGIALRNTDGSVRSTTDVLGDLADKIHSLPTADAQRRFADMWGVGALLQLLRQGRAEVNKFADLSQQHGGVISDEDLKKAEDFERAWIGTTQAARGAGIQIASRLAPAMVPLLEDLSHWLMDTDHIKALAEGIAKVVTAIADAIKGIDWGALVTGITSVLDKTNALVDKLGMGKGAFGGGMKEGFADAFFGALGVPSGLVRTLGGIFGIGRGGSAAPNGRPGGVTGQGQVVPIPPPLGGGLPPHAGLEGATDAENRVLAQVRQRENQGVYDTFHATGGHVGSLADVEAFGGKSHAFGAYGFQPGTYRGMGGGADISPREQDTAALALLRKYGPNATQSWAASGPYDTTGLGAQRNATPAASASGLWSRIAGAIAPSSAHAAPMPGFADISKQAALGNFGQMDAVKGMIVHHTGGGRTVEDVLKTFRQRGVASNFVIDPAGKVFQVLPEGAAGAHIMRGWGPKGAGLNNRNMEGVEIIAADDKHVNAVEKAAALGLIASRAARFGYDPLTDVFGHGEVNPGHRQESEGMTVVNAARAGGAPPVNFGEASAQANADSHHSVDVNFVNAPPGMRSGLRSSTGPADFKLRTGYAMGAI
jgi:hypothetical protein